VHSILQAADPIVVTPRHGSASLREDAQRNVESIHPRVPIVVRPTVQPAPMRPVMGQPAHPVLAAQEPAPAPARAVSFDQASAAAAFNSEMTIARAPELAMDAPVIDWTARPATKGKQKPTTLHQPWVTEFLGVKSSQAQDLASLTGLHVKIPAEPSRDLAK
jgi:hypothetical protein